jgi:hypothetical protein
MRLAVLNPGRPPKKTKGKTMARKRRKPKAARKRSATPKFMVLHKSAAKRPRRRRNPGRLLNVKNWQAQLMPMLLGAAGALGANFAFNQVTSRFAFNPKWNPLIKIGIAAAAPMLIRKNKVVLWGSVVYGALAVQELAKEYLPIGMLGNQADYYALQNYSDAMSLGANQVSFNQPSFGVELGANQVSYNQSYDLAGEDDYYGLNN